MQLLYKWIRMTCISQELLPKNTGHAVPNTMMYLFTKLQATLLLSLLQNIKWFNHTNEWTYLTLMELPNWGYKSLELTGMDISTLRSTSTCLSLISPSMLYKSDIYCLGKSHTHYAYVQCCTGYKVKTP